MALAALPGCEAPKVKITGKVLKGGQPFVVAKETMVTLTFAPEVEGQTYQGRFKHETGTYEAQFPPGKYRVLYLITSPDRSIVSSPASAKEKLHELTKSQEFDIDIAAK
jgi:hypothetical protein